MPPKASLNELAPSQGINLHIATWGALFATLYVVTWITYADTDTAKEREEQADTLYAFAGIGMACGLGALLVAAVTGYYTNRSFIAHDGLTLAIVINIQGLYLNKAVFMDCTTKDPFFECYSDFEDRQLALFILGLSLGIVLFAFFKFAPRPERKVTNDGYFRIHGVTPLLGALFGVSSMYNYLEYAVAAGDVGQTRFWEWSAAFASFGLITLGVVFFMGTNKNKLWNTPFLHGLETIFFWMTQFVFYTFMAFVTVPTTNCAAEGEDDCDDIEKNVSVTLAVLYAVMTIVFVLCFLKNM